MLVAIPLFPRFTALGWPQTVHPITTHTTSVCTGT